MTKSNGADTREVLKLFDDISKRLSSPQLMRKLGAFVILTIRDRTRGKGQAVLQPNGRASQLKRVTPEYAAQRAKMKNRHPQAATGTRSNLTATGVLLDSMVLKRVSSSELFIGFRNRREGLKAEGQERQGRRFLVLSGSEIIACRKFVTKIVADEV
jgi:hypothetical protein